MNIDKENADRLQEIVQEMSKLLGEFKSICKDKMTREEYNLFKYRTLGHIEPALLEESEWVTQYSSIDSLEEIARKAGEDVVECKKCKSSVDEDGYCTNRGCFYFEAYQDDEDESNEPDNCPYCGSGLKDEEGDCKKCGL